MESYRRELFTMSAFELQPTLEGPTVLVRPIDEQDWEALFSVASDPQIWIQHPQTDRYTEPVFRDFFDGAIASGAAFVVVDNASGNLIGSSRYHGYDPALSEVEIGWTFLGCQYWGGGTNRELKQLMLEHAFRFVDTVVFWVGETNLRSRRAVEKIGGQLRDGQYVRAAAPYVIYQLTAADWNV